MAHGPSDTVTHAFQAPLGFGHFKDPYLPSLGEKV